MRCEACGAAISRWSASPLCPTCHAGTATTAPASRTTPAAALWLWTSDSARNALATGHLGVIMRAYRAETGTNQRQLAEELGYDTTYISMIETGRRDITDVATLLRIARHLRLPPHSLGITDPDDADFTAMLQFAESTIRLAIIARHAGHGAEAVDGLWPIVARLEARVAERHAEHDVLHLLARARVELGVSLGYVLPEERLPAAARWTRGAVKLAKHLDDPHLLATALRTHGNELRKIGHPAAAVNHLLAAAHISADQDRHEVLLLLARAAAAHHDGTLFDATISAHQHLNDVGSLVAAPYAHFEVRLRGLLQIGRTVEAIKLLGDQHPPTPFMPPQWDAILKITVGEVLLTAGETTQADTAFTSGIDVATRHQLPHQIQRVQRSTQHRRPIISELAQGALEKLDSPELRKT
jgi:transcriptional regulator with XRE-family HTH domain